jgi:hypothetical protein
VGKGQLVFTKGGDEINKNVSDEFVTSLKNMRRKRSGFGGSLRWALLGTSSNHLILGFQSLPEKASILVRNDPRMPADTAPVVLLLSYAVDIEMNKDGLAPGPIRKIFSKNPDTAKRS